VPFCPLHISHDLKWDQTWAPAVRCWWLTELWHSADDVICCLFNNAI
jgi:hypothetical protein